MLSDRTPDRRPGNVPAPPDFAPGVEYQPDAWTVTTGPLPHLSDEAGWRDAVAGMGLEVPDGWTVRLLHARFDPAAWTRENQGEDAVTRPVWRYRFAVEQTSLGVDHDLVAQALKAKAVKAATSSAGCFVIAIGDTQIGKRDEHGGTDEAVARVLKSVDAAIARFRRTKDADQIALLLLGDHVEGFVSQGGRLAWRTDLAVTDQVRVWRRLLMEIVRRLARLGVPVTVAVVTGNHDEAIRQPVITYANDSWAIDAASAVADACAENEAAYGHVTFYFPADERLDLTLQLAGTWVTLAHGHQWRTGQAMKWWAGQSHGMQPAMTATLLLSGHYHHLSVLTDGTRTHIQVPAMDGGSSWFRNTTGLDAEPGLVTLVIEDGRWSGLEVL